MDQTSVSLDDSSAVHASAIVIDGHADTPQRFADEAWEFTDDLGSGMLSLQSARNGKLAAEFFAIWVDPHQWQGRYAERTLALIEAVLAQVNRHPQELALCITAAGIVQAHEQGRFAVLMGIEGGHSIENDLGLLRRYYDLGARSMTLTWSNTNDWADSSSDIERHGGLTGFGRDVIAEMNRLGMMIDVSHVSDRAFSDVLDATEAPVIASHSSARALTAAPRNLTDEMLRIVAANGGIVMVNFFPGFIDERWRASWNAQREERHAAHRALACTRTGPIPFSASNAIDRDFASRLPRPPLASLIDHIDHVARVAGIEHTGLGSDFDGIPALPEGIGSAADLPKITAAMMDRGYTADQMQKLLGGNLLRVFSAVEVAARVASPPPVR